jgi:DNA invertase Pin-like site-specific DNA recombinase
VIDPTRRRAAVYYRVSTDLQTADNQKPDVIQLVRARGFDVVATYEEQASAAGHRREFDNMMADAHRGLFDNVAVWALDRFGRSMTGNLAAVVELDRLGVNVVSAKEPWLDTSGPARGLLVAIASWVAEQERARISLRTKAALQRLKNQGFHVGRPKARIDLVEARRLRSQGLSLKDVAKTLKVGVSTLHRALADVPKTGGSAAEVQVPETTSAA